MPHETNENQDRAAERGAQGNGGAPERQAPERANDAGERNQSDNKNGGERSGKASSKDLLPLLKGWDYEPGTINVRKINGMDGQPKLQMRLDLGLLQMELDGRPDGVKARQLHADRLLKPAFSANHRWAMARGEESLRLELRRRRALSRGQGAGSVPPPPAPTFGWLLRRRPS